MSKSELLAREIVLSLRTVAQTQTEEQYFNPVNLNNDEMFDFEKLEVNSKARDYNKIGFSFFKCLKVEMLWNPVIILRFFRKFNHNLNVSPK